METASTTSSSSSAQAPVMASAATGVASQLNGHSLKAKAPELPEIEDSNNNGNNNNEEEFKAKLSPVQHLISKFEHVEVVKKELPESQNTKQQQEEQHSAGPSVLDLPPEVRQREGRQESASSESTEASEHDREQEQDQDQDQDQEMDQVQEQEDEVEQEHQEVTEQQAQVEEEEGHQVLKKQKIAEQSPSPAAEVDQTPRKKVNSKVMPAPPSPIHKESGSVPLPTSSIETVRVVPPPAPREVKVATPSKQATQSGATSASGLLRKKGKDPYAHVQSKLRDVFRSNEALKPKATKSSNQNEAEAPSSTTTTTRKERAKSSSSSGSGSGSVKKFANVTPRYLDYNRSAVFTKRQETQLERRKALEDKNAVKSKQRQQELSQFFQSRVQQESAFREEEIRRGQELHDYTLSVKQKEVLTKRQQQQDTRSHNAKPKAKEV